MKAIISIVERGHGAALEKRYAARGVGLHLQCPGRGTATSEILDILGLGSTEKDVVLSLAAPAAARALLRDLDGELRGELETSGLVFSLPLAALSNLAARLATYQWEELRRKENTEPMEHTENKLILAACRRGFTDAVMATAKAAGARGGTVIKARLAGFEALEQAYDQNLTAEREIIAIVVPADLARPVLDAVNHAHGLRQEAQTLLCALPIEEIVRLG